MIRIDSLMLIDFVFCFLIYVVNIIVKIVFLKGAELNISLVESKL